LQQQASEEEAEEDTAKPAETVKPELAKQIQGENVEEKQGATTP